MLLVAVNKIVAGNKQLVASNKQLVAATRCSSAQLVAAQRVALV